MNKEEVYKIDIGSCWNLCEGECKCLPSKPWKYISTGNETVEKIISLICEHVDDLYYVDLNVLNKEILAVIENES